jgi:outer membrane lipoprotein-sorting protein
VDEGETATLWVDPDSGLPVRIELVSLSADRKDKALLIFDQLTWNESLDAALFELEPTEGFTRQDE